MSALARPTAAALLLLASSAAARAALGPRYGGELSVGFLATAPGEDPLLASTPGVRLSLGLIHETLVRIGPGAALLCGLAESWSSAASGREWLLVLDADARFHDDRHVTSEDAVRALRRFLRSSSPAGAAFAQRLEGGLAYRSAATDAVPGLAALDERRVLLRLGEARAHALAPLASHAAAITSPSGAGAGPFVPTLGTPGRSMSLTAFATHARGRSYLDRLRLLEYPRQELLRSEFHAGRVDLAVGEPGQSALAATAVLVVGSPAPRPIAGERERAALAAALLRAELAGLWPGTVRSRGLLVPSLLAADEGPAPRAEPLRGSLSIEVGPGVPALVSQRVVAVLGSIGLRVTARSPGAAERPDARIVVWSPEVPEAGLALRELAALASAEEAVAAIDEADQEPDPERRRALLQQAESALRARHVLLPLAWVPHSFAARPGVHGARIDGGRILLEDAWIEP